MRNSAGVFPMRLLVLPTLMLAALLPACHRERSVAATRADSSGAAEWTDPSPHRVALVGVAPGVRLEVLDWGGNGMPVVFLSGLGDTGHSFDDFAPRLADSFHVLAITRRGFGASSHPGSGYDVGTRVADLTAALDSLHLQRVILVGHSIAGDELTRFAGEHPDRTAGLVYLDAAYDHSQVDSLIRSYPSPEPPPPTAADSASPTAWAAHLRLVYGVPITEADVRANYRFSADGRLAGAATPDSISAAVLRGAGHPDYRRVKAPALAIYAIVEKDADLFPYRQALSDSAQALADTFAAHLRSWAAFSRVDFRREMPNAEVVEIPGANHYVFLSNAAEVEKAMRRFMAPLR